MKIFNLTIRIFLMIVLECLLFQMVFIVQHVEYMEYILTKLSMVFKTFDFFINLNVVLMKLLLKFLFVQHLSWNS